MDSKAEPPAYTEATNYGYSAGTDNNGLNSAGPNPTNAGYPPGYNTGYNQVPGTGQPPAGYDQSPAAGYAQPPAGYAQPPAGYAQPPAGYAQPPAGYAQTPAYMPQQGYAAGGFSQQQQTVVVTQPMHSGMIMHTVPDHMGMAIFTTICCCWPLGIVAIMRAQESRRAVQRGDTAAATTYSMEARRYSIWAIVGGCVSIAIAVGIIVYVINSSSYYRYYSN